MIQLFYIAGGAAVLATLLTITRAHAVHALLYLIVSLLAAAMVMFSLGAPFAAALEVLVYAGAIMVLFVFVVMLLNLGPEAGDQERRWLTMRYWIGPAILSILLFCELLYVLIDLRDAGIGVKEVGAKAVGIALFGPYLLAVELGSMILLAGLVAAYHLGRQGEPRVVPPRHHKERRT